MRTMRLGSVPVRLVKLDNLRELDLEGNDFTGEDVGYALATLNVVVPLVFGFAGCGWSHLQLAWLVPRL